MSLHIVPTDGLLWGIALVSHRTRCLLENLRAIGTTSGSDGRAFRHTGSTLLALDRHTMPEQVSSFFDVGHFFAVTVLKHDELAPKSLDHSLLLVDRLYDR